MNKTFTFYILLLDLCWTWNFVISTRTLIKVLVGFDNVFLQKCVTRPAEFKKPIRLNFKSKIKKHKKSSQFVADQQIKVVKWSTSLKLVNMTSINFMTLTSLQHLLKNTTLINYIRIISSFSGSDSLLTFALFAAT